MKVFWISDALYPSGGADTEVVLQSAAAMGEAGADVTLAVPSMWHRDLSTSEVFAYYGAPEACELVRLPSWPPPPWALRSEKLVHGLLGPVFARMRDADVIHSRDLIPLVVCHAAGLPWSFETYRQHAREKPWLSNLTRLVALERGLGAVAHSDFCREDLLEVGFAPDAILMARVGIQPEQFEHAIDKQEARRELGLDDGAPIVGYAGNIGPRKGTDDLIDMAKRLPDVRFLVVGGSRGDVAHLEQCARRQGVTKLICVGHKPVGEVARYLFASDVLVSPELYPYSHQEWLPEWMRGSILPGIPMKHYSYLAAGRPVVCADQDVSRELLAHEETALFYPPRSIESAVAAIRRLLEDPELARSLERRGRDRARGYTWQARGRRMVDFFERRLSTRSAA